MKLKEDTQYYVSVDCFKDGITGYFFTIKGHTVHVNSYLDMYGRVFPKRTADIHPKVFDAIMKRIENPDKYVWERSINTYGNDVKAEEMSFDSSHNVTTRYEKNGVVIEVGVSGKRIYKFYITMAGSILSVPPERVNDLFDILQVITGNY